ncbi:Leptin receptor [Larimichthys crocea]|uniref:Leptin receptor n=1 Tax=Larimichthys crocea TaxID=215358 RepID=A0A6G0IFI5_LARCR|nr:Leptin receptor [Larimichthys crocea]
MLLACNLLTPHRSYTTLPPAARETGRRSPRSASSSEPGSAASSSSSERLLHCTLPNLKLLTDYILNVTAVTASGESSSHLSSFMLEDIVKPDPPVDVRVSPLNIRNLLVEWSPPPTWANLNIFPLKYQILYQWESRGTPRSINLGPFESTKVELKGLTPGRPYLVPGVCYGAAGSGQVQRLELTCKSHHTKSETVETHFSLTSFFI